MTWTEKARAAQFYETRHIDGNSQAKEKWLEVQIAKIKRRLRQLEQEPFQATASSEIGTDDEEQEA